MGKFFSRRLLYIKQHLLIMLWGHFTKDCFFQSARSGLDCPLWIIILIGPIVVLNRLEKAIGYYFLTSRPVVVLVVRWSVEGRVLTLRRQYARPSVESGRGYRKLQRADETMGTFRVVSCWVACVMQYLAMPEVKRNTALHKQRDMIQLTGSTHCTSIPLIIIIDKEDKTHFHTFRLLLFSSFKSNKNVL